MESALRILTVAVKIVSARLREDQLEEAADLMNLVFLDQLQATSQTATPEQLRRYRDGYLRVAQFWYAHGEPYIATIDGKLVGLVLWMPPNATAIDEEELKEFRMHQLTDLFADTMGHLTPVNDLFLKIRRDLMKGPHWFMPSRLDIHPEYRGRGVATALIRPVLIRADEGGLPCYLETILPPMVPFFQSRGFGVLLEGVEPTAEVPYWVMRRDPIEQPASS